MDFEEHGLPRIRIKSKPATPSIDPLIWKNSEREIAKEPERSPDLPAM